MLLRGKILCSSGLLLAFLFALPTSAATPVFTPGASYPTLAGALTSTTGDFNNDGKIDIAISNTAVDSVSILLGNGNGTFQARVDYTVSNCQVGQIITGDFNRDGNLDVLGTCTLTSTIFVLPGKGDGTFGTPIISSAPMPVVSGFIENYVEPLTTADVNGDGILDLALILQTANVVTLSSPGAVGQTVILTGNGDGTFGHPVVQAIAPVGTETYAVQLADVNGDGKADIVGIAFDYNSAGLSMPLVGFFFVALGDGFGGFTLTQSYSLAIAPQTGMLLGDVNGDGHLDVVFAGLSISSLFSQTSTTNLSGIAVFLGTGTGAFTLGYTAEDSQTVQNQALLGDALAPVFGTGAPDLIQVGYFASLTGDHVVTGGLVVRQNNGDGTFGPAQNLETPTSDQPFSFSVADFNGDGRPDIIQFNFTADLLDLLIENLDDLEQVDLVGKTIATFPAGTAQVLLNNTASGAFTNTNSASYATGGLASASIASAFGTGLATSAVPATGTPLPFALGGSSINVIDSLGVSRPSPLFYASPSQINYEIADGTAPGMATIAIATASGTISVQQQIVPVAPGIFNASGLAAAEVFTYDGATAPVVTPTTIVNAAGQLSAAPIDVSNAGTSVYLILYGTGIRNHQNPVVATVGTTEVTASFAGAQGFYVGEDQINVLLPQSLQAAGFINVFLTADGNTSNKVQIQIQ